MHRKYHTNRLNNTMEWEELMTAMEGIIYESLHRCMPFPYPFVSDLRKKLEMK